MSIVLDCFSLTYLISIYHSSKMDTIGTNEKRNSAGPEIEPSDGTADQRLPSLETLDISDENNIRIVMHK